MLKALHRPGSVLIQRLPWFKSKAPNTQPKQQQFKISVISGKIIHSASSCWFREFRAFRGSKKVKLQAHATKAQSEFRAFCGAKKCGSLTKLW